MLLAVSRALRVVHCPVNVAGIPWENVQALRRKGIDARLVVFERGGLHHEADWSLDRRGGLPHRLATQLAALARLLPATDIFHFLGSDIRGKTPAELKYGKRADAQIVGSYDAIRWVPEAFVVPPGLDLRPYVPHPPSDSPRPLLVHAPSNRAKKGTQQIIEACAQLPVELDLVEGVPHEQARERYARADIVVDQLGAGWHGVFAIEAMALGKPVLAHLNPDVVERSAEAFGVRVPIVPATGETLADALRPLIASPALRREIGAAGRAYVERVHDIDRVADGLLDIYAGL